MDSIREKLKETALAIMPILLLVVCIHFLWMPMPSDLLLRFVIGGVFILVGLTFFLFGVEICITPLSAAAGTAIASRNKVSLVVVLSLLMGFFISIAEPDLLVLAGQIASVTQGSIQALHLLLAVAGGMAVLIMLGFLRTLFNVKLAHLLRPAYLLIGVLALLVKPDFLAIAFDSSGATTGILAVPFMLSFSAGIAQQRRNSRHAEDDAFGLVALASSGAIIAVLLLGIWRPLPQATAEMAFDMNLHPGVLSVFAQEFWHTFQHAVLALAPLVVIFLGLQWTLMKKPKRQFARHMKGLGYAFIGLVIFLWGVNAGFIDLGKELGQRMAERQSGLTLLLVAFIFGLATVLAEPAVHVLATQIKEVTGGAIPARAVFCSLSLGVGLALALSVLRIVVPSIQLWHYLLPGYLLALLLSFFVEPLFVGVAFDGGGVATGPMTATFILAFTSGIAAATPGASVLIDGFGMIAMVALAPILTLQVLGLIYTQRKKRQEPKISAEDAAAYKELGEVVDSWADPEDNLDPDDRVEGDGSLVGKNQARLAQLEWAESVRRQQDVR